MDYISNHINRQMASLRSAVTHGLFQGREELKFQSSKRTEPPRPNFLPHLISRKHEALAGKAGVPVSGIAETQH